MFRQIALISVLFLAPAAAVAADPPTGQAPAPETAAADPVRDMLRRMAPLFEIPRVEDAKARQDEIVRRMKEVLKALDEFEQKLPKAPELTEARLMGLVASVRLATITGEAEYAAAAKAIAAKVAASDAAPEKKLLADGQTLLLAIRPPGKATSAPSDGSAEKAIEAFIDRYAATPQAADALSMAVRLAEFTGNPELLTALEKRLVEKFPDNPIARQMLRRQGKSADIGKPFKAELKTLDGKDLKLPDDLKDKVFVVDFWATWCGYCVAELPEMKKLYAEYKPKGVEFVGISLDKDPAHVAGYVKEKGMDWLHVCTGKGWDDPTFKALGLEGVPSVWVVGKDGLVVSDNARGKLEETIRKALGLEAEKKDDK